MTTTLSQDYATVFEGLKKRIKTAQYQALSAANRELIALYWDIGKEIYTQQAVSGWGSSIIEQLAEDLQKAFPGMRGFSSRNL